MSVFNIISLLGGLALFLFGMIIMSSCLEKIAGGKLEKRLEKITNNSLKSLLLGIGITAAIQSSSAVTVMLIGLVNSGILSLSRTVGIIMGSNIGTTMTAWIISLSGIESDNLFLNLLKPANFSPGIAFIGILLVMAGNKKRLKDIGGVCLGFAVLMVGMEMMSDSMSPLSESTQFAEIMIKFRNPLLGLTAGMILTAIIQSSSASVGILQALSITGVLSYGMAIPIIMGQNIGTCITALIACIGVGANARKVGAIHIYFNVIGTAFLLTGFYLINMIFDFSFMNLSITPAGIAVVHSMFNIATTVILFPFSKKLLLLAEKTVKKDNNKTPKP